MAPFAKIITVTFEKSLNDYKKKSMLLGNPIRKIFLDNKIDKRSASQKLGLRTEKPILLVLGGGTGATAINNFIKNSITDLSKFCQVVHITGKDRGMDFAQMSAKNINYRNFEFLNTEGMLKVFSIADAIVSRCGMGVLTEICYFGIPAILIPMPDTHQEENAQVFVNEGAALVLKQHDLNENIFAKKVKEVLMDTELKNKLKNNVQKVIKISQSGDFANVIKKVI